MAINNGHVTANDDVEDVARDYLTPQFVATLESIALAQGQQSCTLARQWQLMGTYYDFDESQAIIHQGIWELFALSAGANTDSPESIGEQFVEVERQDVISFLETYPLLHGPNEQNENQYNINLVLDFVSMFLGDYPQYTEVAYQNGWVLEAITNMNTP